MAEEGKGLAMVILGIVAVIAVVGLVLLFSKASTTGKYVNSAETTQFDPYELCEQRVGCPLKSIEGGGVSNTFTTHGPVVAICACPDGDVVAPLVRPFDWREEYYSQG